MSKLEMSVLSMAMPLKIMAMFCSAIIGSRDNTCWWDTPKFLQMVCTLGMAIKEFHMPPCWWFDHWFQLSAHWGCLRPSLSSPDTHWSENSSRTIKVSRFLFLTTSSNRTKSCLGLLNRLLWISGKLKSTKFQTKFSRKPKKNKFLPGSMKPMPYLAA